MVDRLYEHTAYTDAPFGPYEKQREISRAGGAAVDVSNAGDWFLVFSLDVSAFKWGQLVIDGEVFADPNSDGTILPNDPGFPWIETRVVAQISSSSFIWFEGAVTKNTSLAETGPIVLPFLLGEMPDSIQVFARARLGGAVSAFSFQKGQITASTRFER